MSGGCVDGGVWGGDVTVVVGAGSAARGAVVWGLRGAALPLASGEGSGRVTLTGPASDASWLSVGAGPLGAAGCVDGGGAVVVG